MDNQWCSGLFDFKNIEQEWELAVVVFFFKPIAKGIQHMREDQEATAA
jgi:hypothetical protein